ncbi:hypothetical protein K2173_009300 [Erythroxylum novogranatense]|uniref:Uncharacterized protein n=1 Tax=Erythroxylum novogranatense TaxID=1862640 RepID=A0AAV8U6N7_9ROSI|nr:hypothetical protein K2173_009300 [Erythroxylum novogranatense]
MGRKGRKTHKSEVSEVSEFDFSATPPITRSRTTMCLLYDPISPEKKGRQLNIGLMSVKKTHLNKSNSVKVVDDHLTSKRRRQDDTRCFPFAEISMEPGKSLRKLDSGKFKSEIRRWAKAVVAYARQIVDRRMEIVVERMMTRFNEVLENLNIPRHRRNPVVGEVDDDFNDKEDDEYFNEPVRKHPKACVERDKQRWETRMRI